MSDKPLAGQQNLLWSINARAVLELVERDGPVARPELVRASGLSKTTVAQALERLVERGAVRELGLDTSRRGPAATLYGVDPGAGHALGVRVSPTTVEARLIDLTGSVLATATAPATLDVASAVTTAAARCAKQAGMPLHAVDAAVVGVPAIVGRDGRTIRVGRGLPRDGAGLVEGLERSFPLPFTLENDANLAAVAELRLGEGRGTKDFALLRIGPGLGAGLVLDGRLHRGIAGGAGEVGFLPQAGLPLGAAVPGLTSDSTGAEISDFVGRAAQVIGAVTLVVEPGLFVLGGPAGAGNEPLAALVRRRLAEIAGPLRIDVRASELGPDADLDGACLLAREQVRENAFLTACQ
ncbi:ROK family protein [Kitasatospora sp. NPDC049285]|uniref:ROK family transcriptional regulator n=1 Tax=Kitasatospora sp. NPDC049285 TaxID=3157096 RepID=UPI00341355DD